MYTLPLGIMQKFRERGRSKLTSLLLVFLELSTHLRNFSKFTFRWIWFFTGQIEIRTDGWVYTFLDWVQAYNDVCWAFCYDYCTFNTWVYCKKDKESSSLWWGTDDQSASWYKLNTYTISQEPQKATIMVKGSIWGSHHIEGIKLRVVMYRNHQQFVNLCLSNLSLAFHFFYFLLFDTFPCPLIQHTCFLKVTTPAKGSRSFFFNQPAKDWSFYN